MGRHSHLGWLGRHPPLEIPYQNEKIPEIIFSGFFVFSWKINKALVEANSIIPL